MIGKKLPIPDVTPDRQLPIIKLVDSILTIKTNNPQADTTDLEKKIDQLVYKLYGLTKAEIKIVENSK